MYVIRNLLRNEIIFARNVCNQSEGKYIYCDAIHALRDYIRSKPQLHTNPSDWIKIKHLSKQVLYFLERVMGIEPTQPAWKAGILAVELHPQIFNKCYYITFLKLVKGKIKKDSSLRSE